MVKSLYLQAGLTACIIEKLEARHSPPSYLVFRGFLGFRTAGRAFCSASSTIYSICRDTDRTVVSHIF